MSSDSVQWKYVYDDPGALSEIKRRLEAAARGDANDLPNYARLVDGIWFHLSNVNDGQPFEMDWSSYTPLSQRHSSHRCHRRAQFEWQDHHRRTHRRRDPTDGRGAHRRHCLVALAAHRDRHGIRQTAPTCPSGPHSLVQSRRREVVPMSDILSALLDDLAESIAKLVEAKLDARLAARREPPVRQDAYRIDEAAQALGLSVT